MYLNQLILKKKKKKKKKSTRQASYLTMVLTVRFQLFKKQLILWK